MDKKRKTIDEYLEEVDNFMKTIVPLQEFIRPACKNIRNLRRMVVEMKGALEWNTNWGDIYDAHAKKSNEALKRAEDIVNE